MKFTLDNGALTITAETGKEIAELCKHFNLDIADHVDELVAGQMTHTSHDKKRPWFAVEAIVPYTFLLPYYQLLVKVTGYDGPPFHIEDDRLRYGSRLANLCHTHLVTGAFIDGDGYHAKGFIASQDWNGKSAAERAIINFNEYLRADLGDTKNEPEFLEFGNGGLLKRNPNYMTRHQPHPALGSVHIFELIFMHWLAVVAAPAQVAAYEAGETCYRTVCNGSLASSFTHGYNDGFSINGSKDTITFAQFKEMGNA